MQFKLYRVTENIKSSYRYYKKQFFDNSFRVTLGFCEVLIGISNILFYLVTLILSFLFNIFISGFIEMKEKGLRL